MMTITKTTKHVPATVWLLFILLTTGCDNAMAQQFEVKKFSRLPNDVGAFIYPVKDLNGEACAVVKVEAPEDFAFSTPLGIVKRKDDVGEILLYLPKGSKMLTIKHPQWGVLRDYRFPEPLESHVTYQLTLNLPQQSLAVTHDTIVLTKTVTDTIAIKATKPKVPLRTHIIVTSAFHNGGPSFGLMAVLMRRMGVFVHLQSDFGSTGKTVAHCDKDGYTDSEGTLPYYTGATRDANYTVTAGLTQSLGGKAALFCGAGYGSTRTAWQLAESEGGGYAVNDGLTHKGLAAEAGGIITFGRLSVSASIITVAGKQWQGTIGIGIKLSKK